MTDEDASVITQQLESLCWRVDTYDSTFKKYYINLGDLNDFLSVVSQYSSRIILHTPNYAPVDTDSFYPVREVLVKKNSNIPVEDVLVNLNIPFERIVPNPYNPQCYSIALPSDDAMGVAATLYETGYFDYSEPNFVFSNSLWGYETNPMYYEQWAIHNDSVNINLLPAWNITTGDNNIKVAVLDMGVEQNHPDLEDNMADGYDAVVDLYYNQTVSNGWNGSLYDAHGTNCAGVICAVNNDIGLIGVAPSSKVSSIRIGYLRPIYVRNLRENDHPSYHLYQFCTSISWITTGLRYACYSNMSDVLNCSFGVLPSDEIENTLTEVCLNGRNGKGCVVVAAAGNNENGTEADTLGCIARHGDVISVGSINPCGERVINNVYCEDTPGYSSCYGDSLDVMAPGILIPTTTTGFSYLGYDYNYSGAGTSLASPHVAGVAALVLSVNPCLTREEVKYVIESTCTKTRQSYYTYGTNPDHPNGTWNNEVGYGLVNAYAAVQLAQQLAGYTYITDSVISGNVVWNDERIVHDSLVIDSLATLTVTDTVYMSSTARIIVRPGGKLVVDGGTLTSMPCSNRLWQGIEVVGDRTKQQLSQYQGRVELRNGAVIENARCGIRTGLREDTVTFATTGGIIVADSAIFLNNSQSVVINSYAFTAPSGTIAGYNASFSRCSFTVNSNNLFAANNTAFAEHVKLWDVRNIPFSGCRFENLTNSITYNGRGIYAEDAGVNIRSYCSDPLLNPDCQCPETLTTRSSFTGFTTAVEVLTAGNPYAVKVSRSNFSNNVTGIKVNGNLYTSITQCEFNLQSTPETVNTNTGLILNHCSGYKVEGNAFNRSSVNYIPNPTGISVINSGTKSNSIYRNAFNKMRYGIHVSDTNGGLFSGLTFSCNDFTNCEYGIYALANATLTPSQGNLSKGVDNSFSGTQISSFYNLGPTRIIYYHSNGSSSLYLANPTGVVAESDLAAGNDCLPTICNPGGGGIVPPIPSGAFLAGMSAYTAALAANNDNTDILDNNNLPNLLNLPTTLAEMHQTLSDTYYGAVRTLMSDSLLDLNALEQWHTAAQPIADPYSLTETRFMEGYTETFAGNADSAEMANYAEFHAMKVALRNNGAGNDGSAETQNFASLQLSGHVNWYALTPAQIAQLQTIAERNTGRASVMAKGVLCFFFGICYEDEDYASETDPSAETRAKRTATGDEGVFDTPLRVWPNPTDDLLFVELRGAEIATVALYDLQGRVVETRHGTSLQGGTATVNMRNVPAGVYVLRVTDAEGKVHQQKIVRK
jgi:subtilisin family serine protease